MFIWSLICFLNRYLYVYTYLYYIHMLHICIYTHTHKTGIHFLYIHSYRLYSGALVDHNSNLKIKNLIFSYS